MFKYLPDRYAIDLVERGDVLFRSLSYFRQQEHAARGDEIEGVHVDAPNNLVTLHNTRTGRAIRGAYRFLNSIDQDRVFAFCCSTKLSLGLLDAFRCDACVRLLDPDLFFLKCDRAARRHLPLEPPGLLHRPVEYFNPAEPARMSVKDPRSLPFFKHEVFRDQCEYRAVFACSGGFRLLQRIVQPQFTLAEEIGALRPSERFLHLGNLAGVVELVDVGSMPA